MEVSRWPHASAVLYPRKSLVLPLNKRLFGLHFQLWRFEKEEKSAPPLPLGIIQLLFNYVTNWKIRPIPLLLLLLLLLLLNVSQTPRKFWGMSVMWGSDIHKSTTGMWLQTEQFAVLRFTIWSGSVQWQNSQCHCCHAEQTVGSVRVCLSTHATYRLHLT